jgi:hypothetical protein
MVHAPDRREPLSHPVGWAAARAVEIWKASHSAFTHAVRRLRGETTWAKAAMRRAVEGTSGPADHPGCIKCPAAQKACVTFVHHGHANQRDSRHKPPLALCQAAGMSKFHQHCGIRGARVPFAGRRGVQPVATILLAGGHAGWRGCSRRAPPPDARGGTGVATAVRRSGALVPAGSSSRS